MKKINIENLLSSFKWKQLITDIINELYLSFNHWNISNKVKLSLKTLDKNIFISIFEKLLLLEENNLQSDIKSINKILSKNNITAIDESFVLLLYNEYLWKSWKIRNDFINFLKDNWVNICPYCNFQPINDQQLNYDHILNKDENKFLAFSLKNLLPTCTYCNQKKSTNSYYNFYKESIISDFKFEFKFNNIEDYKENNVDKIEIRNLIDKTESEQYNLLESFLKQFIEELYTNKQKWEWNICLNNLKKFKNKRFYESFNDTNIFEDWDYWEITKIDLDKIHKVPFSKFKLCVLDKKNYNIDFNQLK